MFDYTREITVKGRWWIPGNDTTEMDGLYGELSFSPTNGLSLTIEGSFFNTRNIMHARHNFQLQTVFGVIKEKHFITLFSVLGTETGHNSWITTSASAEYGMSSTNGYFAAPDTDITGLNFNTNYFAAFFKGFRKTLQVKHGKKNVVFSYDEVPVLTIIKNEVDVHFYFSYSFKGLGMIAEEFSFLEKIFLNIHYEKYLLPGQIIQKLNFLRDLFSFFCYSRMAFQLINVFAKNKDGEQVEFAFLFKDSGSNLGNNFSNFDILLSYVELEAVFPNIFQIWLDNEEMIQSGLLLYLQVKHLKFPSDIQTFLNLVFAVETLHNTWFDYKILIPEEMRAFKTQKDIAIKSFDACYQKRVKDCLSHFNSPVFSDRLKDLIHKSKDFLGEYIYDIDDFCRRVKLQRNFLAHNHSQSKKNAIEDKHYPYFIAMLKLIFECSFLPRIGLAGDQLMLSIRRNFSYQYFLEKLPGIKKELCTK